MKKIAIMVVAAAVIVAALLGLRPLLMQVVIRKGAAELGNRFQESLLTDGRLHVVMVGTGSPAPDPYRAQACTAVIVEGAFILFDCGSGAASRVESLGLPVAALDVVFLTHLHADHIADLPLIADTSWRYGRKRKLEVHGPAGPEKPMALDMIAGVEHYHSSPKDAAEIAAEAGVKTLVLTHIMPPIGPPAFGRLLTNGMFLDGASGLFKGKVVIAEDGMQFAL